MTKILKMNAFRLLLALTMLAGLQVSAIAADFPVLKVTVLGADQKIALTIEGLDNDARLTLIDAEGVVLHAEEVSATALYRKLLNLRSLPSGAYKLLLESSTQEVVQPFQISDTGVICRPEDCRRVFAPSFKLEGRSLDLSLLSQEGGEVQLSLVNEAGFVVYESAFTTTTHKLERRFDLRRLAAAEYVVYLTYGGRTWTKTIVVE